MDSEESKLQEVSILYVDDEPALLDIGKIFLERSKDLFVTTAQSAKEAIKLLSDKSYDVIVSDYQMPDMDGIEFLKHLRAEGNMIPFIIFTGKGREEVVIEALNEGADFYIQKGGDPRSQFAELIHKIRKAFSGKKAEESLIKNTEALNKAYEDLTASEEELRQNLDEMIQQDRALRESERQLSNIIEFLPDATFVIDNKGIVISWNRAMEEMTGISKEKMIGQGEHAYTVPFYGRRRKQLMDLIEDEDDEIKSEYRHLTRKGDTFYAEASAPALYKGKGGYIWTTGAPLLNTAGERVGSIESIRDITERNRAETALKESENLYRTIFETTGAATIIIEENTTIKMANSGFAALSGFSTDELEGKKSWTEFVIPEDIEWMKEYHRKRRDDPLNEKRIYEFRFLNRKGEIRYCINNVRIIPGTTLSVASVVDITERKQTEKILEESEMRYRCVVEDQTEFVCRFLPDRTHVFVNEAYCRYFDRSRDEILGKKFRPEIPARDRKRLQQFLKSLTQEHPAGSIEHQIIMPDQTTRWQLWSERAIFDAKGSVVEFQSVGRDITDRKLAENALRLTKRKLRILSAITRHDILNQITVLQGYLNFACEISNDPKQAEYLEKLDERAAAIRRSIEFTREYEQLGVDKPAWLDISEMILNLDNREILSSNNCCDLFVYADPMLEKVFANLIDNTIRHGGGSTEAHLLCVISKNELTIIWEDNGKGIPDCHKEIIFERGFGKNTGFGLFLTREILSITGMTIKETGEAGKGARFEISVPKGGWKTSKILNGTG